MELIKKWNDGGSLTATYGGSGDGTAVFTSDINEGIDREMTVVFKGGDVSVERTVKQEGLREIFENDFLLADGGTFNVLKNKEPFTRLEYLESDGTQWIDTGYTFDYTKDTVLSAEAMALSTDRTIIMGSYYDANYRCMAIEFGGSSNSHVGAARGYIMIKKSAALDMWASNKDINVKRSISLSFTASNRKAVLDFDGEQKTGTASAGTLAAKATTRMFIDNRATNINAIQYPLRIYSAQIQEGGELVRDFIPVVDKDGVACMYDKVNKEYYYNQGTGNFTPGYK